MEKTIHKPKNTDSKVCKNCGQGVKLSNIFCSNRCSAIFNNQRRTHKERVKLICSNCGKEVGVAPNVARSKRKNKKFFCSKECRANFNTKNLNCSHCGILFQRKIEKKHNNKSGKEFCSKSCRMTYFNIHHHINKGCLSNVSFPEDFLFESLFLKFPSVKIIRNDRETLKCGYEIDLYFPDLKFGIEVNGPTHYMPIFGEMVLSKTQLHDSIKYQEMHDSGISFLIVDVSFPANKKKMSQHLSVQLQKVIIPLIESKISTQ